MSEGTFPAEALDLLHLDELLTDEERAVRDRVRETLAAAALPVINDYWERAEFPFALLPRIAELAVVGGSISGYGCPGLSSVAEGLVSQEFARVDGSLFTFLVVQSSLAMGAIYRGGSEEQRQRWLPPMARLEALGAFALTEPNVGSDAGHLETRASRDGDGWVLDGAKRWIGNGTIADVVVVWARDDEGKIGGFLVEKGTPGYEATRIAGKVPERAVWQADIRLSGCRVPLSNRLPNATGFRSTLEVLMHSRYNVAWAALGHALAGYEGALRYATERRQFGKPIGSFQLTQAKLVRMVSEISAGQLVGWRIGRLADAGRLTAALAALAKYSNAARAREIVALAREVMGGNGILLENHVMRHLADLEALYTYEGTSDINALLVGRAITGLDAFA